MIEENDLADEAFEDSSQYEFKGIPLYFSFRHYYALLAIMAEAQMSAEEQCLLIFWIATHNPDQIKELRQRWRKDQDEVFDDFENVPELYDLAPGSNDLLEIAEIANKIWNDIENSKDTVKPSKNDKEGEGLPKK
jgi:hypothetical protein